MSNPMPAYHRKAALGRTKVAQDAVNYLRDLNAAAAYAEHALTGAALTGAGYLLVEPIGTGRRMNLPSRNADLFPPLAMHHRIAEVDAERVEMFRRIWAAATQTYAVAALAVLRAVLNGDHVTPALIEVAVADYNRLRPIAEVERERHPWAIHNRPGLPAMPELTTGHPALDLDVAAARAALVDCYAAAMALEEAEALDDRHPVLDEDEESRRGELTAEAGALPRLLMGFGEAVARAATLGHSDPLDVDEVPDTAAPFLS